MTLLLASLALISAPTQADDIDVYYPEADAAPNIMFVVDASGSMALTDGTGKTRMQRIRSALQLALANMEGVKVGLTQFRDVNRAKVLLPVAALDSTEFTGGSLTHREVMQNEVNQIPTNGYTPTVEGLYETALYFAGKPVSSVMPTADGILLEGAPVPTYRSPSYEGCNSSSYIVLLTDGEPTARVSTGKVQNLVGKTCSSSNNPSFGDLEYYLACGRELVDALAHKPGLTKFTEQPVYLFTVGLGIQNGDAWLKHFADRGRHPDLTGENFFSLSGNASELELAAALQDIVRDITKLDISNVAQPVPASNFQGVANKGDLYLGVYGIGPGEYWPGNVHKFRLGSDAIIYDKNNAQAVGDDGYFKDTALGYWTNDVNEDGGAPEVGGARENLPNKNQRKIYTHLEAAGTNNLTDDKNKFHPSNVKTSSNANGLLTPALFGVGDAKTVTDLVDWARDGRLMDPLHTAIQLVTYDHTDEENSSYIFYGDNGGFLRAMSAKTGREVFSFIPEPLLKNLNAIRADELGAKTTYGVDGPISVSIEDNYGEKGVIDGDDDGDDRVTVYFGLRRGAAIGHIFALDVTDIQSPKLRWTRSSEDADFSALGQTWSRLVKTQVLINDTLTSVLLFGGGYDTDKDEQTARAVDDVGNALFMVNAENGNLIWSAGSAAGHTESLSAMKYSIPGSVRLLDLDEDGLADRFYFGDTGGQLWRCTVNSGLSLNELIDCEVMLSAATDAGDQDRRFFETPDVSRVNVDGEWKLAVAIGSGNRANPKDIDVDPALRDRFFVVHDTVKKQAPGPSGLTASALYDASTQLYDRQTATDAEKEEIQRGWFMTLRPGEKVLSTAATHEGVLYFSTYKHVTSSDLCSVGEGDSRLYRIQKATGQPAEVAGASPTLEDRYEPLDTAAIPVSPAIFRVADSSGVLAAKGAQICVGLECIFVPGGNRVEAGYFQSSH